MSALGRMPIPPLTTCSYAVDVVRQSFPSVLALRGHAGGGVAACAGQTSLECKPPHAGGEVGSRPGSSSAETERMETLGRMGRRGRLGRRYLLARPVGSSATMPAPQCPWPVLVPICLFLELVAAATSLGPATPWRREPLQLGPDSPCEPCYMCVDPYMD